MKVKQYIYEAYEPTSTTSELADSERELDKHARSSVQLEESA